MLLPVVSLLVAEHLGGAPVQLVQQQLRGVRPASQPPAARHGPGLAESATSDQCAVLCYICGVSTAVGSKNRGSNHREEERSGHHCIARAKTERAIIVIRGNGPARGNNSPALHWVTDSQGQHLAILLPFFLLPQLS